MIPRVHDMKFIKYKQLCLTAIIMLTQACVTLTPYQMEPKNAILSPKNHPIELEDPGNLDQLRGQDWELAEEGEDAPESTDSCAEMDVGSFGASCSSGRFSYPFDPYYCDPFLGEPFCYHYHFISDPYWYYYNAYFYPYYPYYPDYPYYPYYAYRYGYDTDHEERSVRELINDWRHYKKDSWENVRKSLAEWREERQKQWTHIRNILNERREQRSERRENFREELYNRFDNLRNTLHERRHEAIQNAKPLIERIEEWRQERIEKKSDFLTNRKMFQNERNGKGVEKFLDKKKALFQEKPLFYRELNREPRSLFNNPNKSGLYHSDSVHGRGKRH